MITTETLTRSGDSGSAGRARSVLVAEASDATREFPKIMADNLTADGYRVRTAGSHENALAVLTVEEVDVIVIDVNGNTLGMIDAVRSGDGFASRDDPDIPMIVLSARGDELHRIRVLDRGGDDVLAKPFSYPSCGWVRRPGSCSPRPRSCTSRSTATRTGRPTIRFTDADIDQARAAGVLIELERIAPIITDRPMYRELCKQAIERTVEELLAKTVILDEERKAAKSTGKPLDPDAEARRERGRQLRQLAEQAHGANLDLDLGSDEQPSGGRPGLRLNVARLFVLCGRPHRK